MDADNLGGHLQLNDMPMFLTMPDTMMPQVGSRRGAIITRVLAVTSRSPVCMPLMMLLPDVELVVIGACLVTTE
jgi:hypothetical protein